MLCLNFFSSLQYHFCYKDILSDFDIATPSSPKLSIDFLKSSAVSLEEIFKLNGAITESGCVSFNPASCFIRQTDQIWELKCGLFTTLYG